MIITLGATGPLVVALQKALDVAPADGKYGPKTGEAVRNWRSLHDVIPAGTDPYLVDDRMFKLLGINASAISVPKADSVGPVLSEPFYIKYWYLVAGAIALGVFFVFKKKRRR